MGLGCYSLSYAATEPFFVELSLFMGTAYSTAGIIGVVYASYYAFKKYVKKNNMTK